VMPGRNMKYPFFICAACALKVMVLPAMAGTLIESTDNVGNNVTVLIGDEMARVDSSDLDGYMVVDMSRQKIYVVSNDEQVVIDLSSSAHSDSVPDKPPAAGPERPVATYVDEGTGPEIAGYATRHYKVMVGGMLCFDEFLSKKMIQNPGVHKFIEVMAKQSQAQENEGMIEYFAADNPCESAEDVMDQQHLSLGLPLRTLDDQGVAIYEITQITLNAAAPAASFKFPDNFPLISRDEMMQRMIGHIRPRGEESFHDNPHGDGEDVIPESGLQDQ
jgi:hypothetical protein